VTPIIEFIDDSLRNQMKKRILSFGIPATHEQITFLPSVNDEMSMSDFDALVFDPQIIAGTKIPLPTYLRRQREIKDLVTAKGGIVICLLRPKMTFTQINNNALLSTYSFLVHATPNAIRYCEEFIEPGAGSQFEVLSVNKGVSSSYFRILGKTLRFVAYLNTTVENLNSGGGIVFANDSIAHPIAVEFTEGVGRICFLPIADGITGDRLGAALVQVVEAHFGGPTELEAPEWLKEIEVPGASANNAKIEELEKEIDLLKAEVAELKKKRSDILNFRVLLYGSGKSVLEPVVRVALRQLGFQVPDPQEYAGEWDIELSQPGMSETGIGEIEGSLGVIDVDKYRQLLDYIQAEVLEGRDHKGILVGNGFRLMAPDADERLKPFSDHALRGATKNGFCLLPATELFKAACAVLEAPGDEGLKIRIRQSIFSTVGVWTFAREIVLSPAADSPDLT
jgi:hypothetical protein